MKKLIALLLLLAALLPAVLTGCADPFQDKIDQMNDIFNQLGDSYYRVTEAVNYHFESNITDDAVKSKLTKWKKDIKAAANVNKSGFDLLTEDEMDMYIANWSTMLDNMNALYDQYKEEITSAKEELKQYDNN